MTLIPDSICPVCLLPHSKETIEISTALWHILVSQSKVLVAIQKEIETLHADVQVKGGGNLI